MRGLLAATPVDVASSDRHTVKPWLDAKLGVSPPAIDFADRQFALIGGRVDVIDGRSVPSLVYRHNEHLISLIALPAGPQVPPTEPVAFDVGGYHIVKWSGKGFSYWAVSDLEPAELGAFVKLYREQS
jgi:anti-sigma factor RsiW